MKIASRTHYRQFADRVIAPAAASHIVPCGVPAPKRSRQPLRIARIAACFAVGSVMLPVSRAAAGSLVVPAWAFSRGNALIHASPDPIADAAPVVSGGPEQPWGWRLEYDLEVPVAGKYTLQVCYAAAEARPIEVFFDDQDLGTCCIGVTLGPASSGKPAEVTWNSSGAKWEIVRKNYDGTVTLTLTKGKHTMMFTRRGPLPHLLALRLDTPEAFPADWKPPQYTVRDPDSIPAASRTAFQAPGGVNDAILRLPIEVMTGFGSCEIPAWSFDRGNARIYASPDQYADAGPIVGSDPQQTEAGFVEYDLDFPATGEYTLAVSYAAAEARPVDVLLDNQSQGTCCTGVTFGSAPFEQPATFTWNSSGALKKWEALSKQGRSVKLSATQGKHTLKFTRNGPLPHLMALRLDGLPTEQRARKVRNLDSVPATQRTAFLPPDAVNTGALRLAMEDMIATLGTQYPGGPQYLERLAGLEKKQKASEGGPAEEQQKIEDALKSLRREAMLAHPELKFDKLLFVKRIPFTGNTYQDSQANQEGGNLCILSPVTADGKVTTLVPELDGGIFSRFDLSFDAKKVIFGYKKKDKAFRIYEIDIDPAAGKMLPGSLRQLTFGSDEETEAVRLYGAQNAKDHGLDDMDPCYLPNGKVIFTSTRSMRNVFCNPSVVTTLYLMDADGKNMHCLSGSPLNEIDPCMLDDGRVVYTRWEYVDKGLGNGQSLWAMRPDGSNVEHLYKNSIVRPAQMLNARSIPGSQRLVTVGAPHCNGRVGGPVILVDYRATRSGPEAMTCINPEIGYMCMNLTKSDMGFFREPYPFSEKFFLVSHRPGPPAKDYGIYVLDGWGNRAELYMDPKLSCFQPVPLRPRAKPSEISSLENIDTKQKQEKTGTVFLQDVYQGLAGIERGRVKYLRVMGALPWPWSENGIFRVSMAGDVHRKKVYGIAKIHADGSACFTVPAGENLLFQALDENYMQLQHMPTFINLRPGENRSCIGCHEPRKNAPGIASVAPLALGQPAQALDPQPGETGPFMVHYPEYVQPVLDKRCVACHSGANPKGRLDLSGEITNEWNRSYENLVGKALVSMRDCRYGRAGFRPEPPLSFGSHFSKLVDQIRHDPCKADLTREEFIKIVTWIDANSPYLGKYGVQGGSKN
jgi:hypothetical protein